MVSPVVPSRGFDAESGAVDLAERIEAGARDVRARWYVRRGQIVARAERVSMSASVPPGQLEHRGTAPADAGSSADISRPAERRCHDCAFTKGTEANNAPHTGVTASLCVLAHDPFYCHVEDRVCGGFTEAMRTRAPDKPNGHAKMAGELFDQCVRLASADEAAEFARQRSESRRDEREGSVTS